MKRPIHWRWIFTFLPLLCCLVFDPRLMSGHFVPKSLWVGATLSLGFLVVWPRRGESMRPSLIGVLWLAWLAWSLFSMLWAPQKMVVIDRCGSLFVLPALACILARRTRFWESDSFWLALSLLVILIGAVGTLLYAEDYVIRVLDAFLPSRTTGFKAFAAVFPGTAQPRVTFGQRNVGSMFMLGIVPFLAWRYFRVKGPGAIISGLALGAGLFFILIARTRGAWVGVAVAAGCAALCGVHRPMLARKPKLVILATCALLALAAAVVIKPAESFELVGSKASVEETLKVVADDPFRLEMFRDAIIRTPPLLGAGCGNYPILSTPYTRSGNPRTLNWEVHNDFIQAYADCGILGLLLMLAFVAALLTTAWRRRNEGIVLAAGLAVAGLAVMLNTTYIMEKVSTQIWMAHVIAILIAHSSPSVPKRVSRRGAESAEEEGECCGSRAAEDTPLNDSRNVAPREQRRSNGRGIPRSPFASPPPSAPSAPLRETLPLPHWPRVLTNTLIIAYLLFFTAIVGITYYADWRLRRAEALIMSMRHLPPARRARGAAMLAKEIPYLANTLHPMIHFNLKNKHVYGHYFAGYAMVGGHRAAACAFARTALAIQPADGSMMRFLSDRALEKGRREEGVAYLEQYVDTFGPKPDSDIVLGLAMIYRLIDQDEDSARLEQGIKARILGVPTQPTPANRAATVPLDVTFDWSDCTAAEEYELHLWKSGEQTPKWPVAAHLKTSQFQPRKPLLPNTVYFWRVTALGKDGEERSELWFFRTRRAGGRGEG